MESATAELYKWDETMKGHIVPKSKRGDDLAVRVDKGDIGAGFDMSSPFPQQIVICDPTGKIEKSFEFGTSALRALRNRNNTKSSQNPIGYDAAVQISGNARAPDSPPKMEKEAAKPQRRRRRSIEIPQGAQLTKADPEKGSPVPSIEESHQPEEVEVSSTAEAIKITGLDKVMASAIKLDPEKLPKVKVKFIGPFGTLTVPYIHVYANPPVLLMLQYSQDEMFYEAPQGDQPVQVTVEGRAFTCYPGPNTRLGEGSFFFLTIYFIESEENG